METQLPENFIPLDAVVKSVINERFESSPHYYHRFLQFGIECLRDEISWTNGKNYIKTAKLKVNGNYTVDLPNDYIIYTKIGIQDGERVRILGLNNSLASQVDVDACGNPAVNAPPAEITFQSDVPLYNFYQNGAYGTLYGYRQSSYPLGNYKIEQGQILFDSRMTSPYVYVEYKTSKITNNGQTLVPIEAVPTVKAYMHKKGVQYRKSSTQWQVVSSDQEYQYALRDLRLKSLRFTEEEFWDALLYTQTVAKT